MRCGPKSKNDLRVKSAAKSDAQCRVSRLPDVYVRASSSSTRRGATIDSRESSADVDERWKKNREKKRKIPRSGCFQGYTGISPSESYGAQIRYTISNSLDSDTRLGSQIQSTATPPTIQSHVTSSRDFVSRFEAFYTITS